MRHDDASREPHPAATDAKLRVAASGEGVLLAIEVSQREGGVAMAPMRAGAAVEIAVGPPDEERDRLMPAIDEAFRTAGAAPRDLAAVIVSVGPGGFTGLRMAVATAKALSLATRCRLIALPSAVVAAATFAAERSANGAAAGHGGASPNEAAAAAPLLVALASKGADAWISLVEVGAGGSRLLRAELADAAAFERIVRQAVPHGSPVGAAKPGGAVLICDEHLPAEIAAAADRLGVARARLRLSPDACLREGRVLAERGVAVSVDELLPLYPREAEAVRLWRERHRSGTGAGAGSSA